MASHSPGPPAAVSGVRTLTVRVRAFAIGYASGVSPPTDEQNSTTLTLTTGGITLLGVLLSIGVTVALGLGGAWWSRALAGFATTVVLVIVVKLGTSSGRGPLARLANWTISSHIR